MEKDSRRKQLPETWKTERLTVRNATEEDLTELRKIHTECAYMEDLIGNHEEAEDPILEEFSGERLPPGGKKELHRLQTMCETASGDIIGYLISYHGYPDRETFWIACLAVRPAFQRRKFGREIVERLIEKVKELGRYSKIGIGVGVGNDPAMKFWSSCGFTNVIKTVKHEKHSDVWIVMSLKN